MKVYLYILDTLADWEIGYLTAELNSGRYFDRKKEPVSLMKIGNTNKTIKTMGGVKIIPDETINNIKFNENDMLILPGADTWMNQENKNIKYMVAQLINNNVTVAAICGATIALAENGLLNEKKHTSNSKEYLKMSCPAYSGEKNYLNKPAITDNNLITATGLSPLEFTYEIFKKLDVMKEETLEAWYGLYKTRKEKYFYDLMKSLE